MAPSRASVPSVESPRVRPSGGLTFLQPEEQEPATNPTDLPSSWADDTTSPSSLDRPEPSPSPSDELLDESDESSDERRRSSTGSRGGSTLKVTRDAARKTVRGAGVLAHKYLTRDEVDRFVGLYLTDEEDERDIGDPLGKIVKRHAPLGDAGNADVIDGLNALAGLVVYAFKQVDRIRAAAKVRRQLAAEAAAHQDEHDQQDGQL